jgi:hypothetical protein
MLPPRWIAPALLFALPAPGAAGATIDFEDPEISSPYEWVIPYEVDGVTFTALPSGSVLFREDAFGGCANPANQWLGGRRVWGLTGPVGVWADFPEYPADPVYTVTAELATDRGDYPATLALELYDASDQLVGSSTMVPVLQPDPDCWLRQRGVLTATSAEPVHHAVMFAYIPPQGDCIGELGDCWDADVYIDNLTYGAAPVFVDATGWGGVKARYR